MDRSRQEPPGESPGRATGAGSAGPRFLALVCALATACGGGGGGGGAPQPEPVVTLLSTTCPSGVGNLAGTTCLLLRVTPAGTTSADVELRVTEPDSGVPYVGTAVLISGNNGDGFFTEVSGGEAMASELAAVGLRVVDRRWVGGWLQGGSSLTAESSRLPDLLDWIHANQHQGGLFFGVGNSGGAGELGYALTTWGRAGLFDAVALLAGPSFSRLDYLCQPVSPAWSAQCPALFPTMECGLPPCSAEGNPLCTGALSSLGTPELLADSILHPGAETDFGAMVTNLVIGADDCSEWVAQALLFEAAVTSSKTFQLVPGTPHGVTATPQGRDAVIQALLGFTPFPSAPPSSPVGFSYTLLEDGQPRAQLRGTAAPR